MAPDATVVADTQGQIRLVNRQTELLFGYAREELLGQPVEALIPERFHHAHRGHRAEYVAEPRTRPMGASLQLAGRRRDGSEFPVEVSLAPLVEDRETLIIASIRDITELQRVHAARREAEAANYELRRLQILTDTALAHLELDDLLPELLVRLRDVMGVDNAAILLLDADGQHLVMRAVSGLEEAAAPQARVPLGQGFAGQIAASREPLIVEDLATFPVSNSFLREQLRSAVGVPLLRHARVLGVLHVGMAERHEFTEQDVQLLQRAAERIALAIERARLYEDLRASEARLRRLVEAGIVGIAIGKGNIVYEANDTLVHMLGYTRADLAAGRIPWFQRPAAEDDMYGDADGRARRALFALGVCTPYEREFLRPDGTRLPVLVGAAMLTRETLEWVCFAVDMSERRWLEREREQARASELAVREVNQHLDEFFHTAAHDLRQPVAVARGHVALALRRFEQIAVRRGLSERQVAQLAGVHDSLLQTQQSMERMGRLTTELFDIARARTGTLALRLAYVNLATLVAEQVAAQRIATPSRTIHLERPEGSPPVWVRGDATRLRQVLTNYLSNALKYSAADQPVTVRLEVAEHLAVVSVQDLGPGLAWEEQSRVWEMFHRAPGVQVRSGTEGSLGMGLHIVKRLVELHPGGRVGVESMVGKGSTFWFRLPLASVPDIATAASEDERANGGK